MKQVASSVRDALIFNSWKAHRHEIFMSQDEFINSFEGWEAVSTDDGAFVAFVRGPEFHFKGVKQGASLSMRSIKEFLNSLIEKHGFAFTRTPDDDVRQQRFNERIGFFRAGQTEFDIIYRIERVTCRSLQ